MSYRAIAEWFDRAIATLAFAIVFNIAWAALLGVDADASNLFISVLTANLVLLAAVVARAAWAALHAKLDALIAATTGADDALIRAEERDEREIGELRL